MDFFLAGIDAIRQVYCCFALLLLFRRYFTLSIFSFAELLEIIDLKFGIVAFEVVKERINYAFAFILNGMDIQLDCVLKLVQVAAVVLFRVGEQFFELLIVLLDLVLVLVGQFIVVLEHFAHLEQVQLGTERTAVRMELHPLFPHAAGLVVHEVELLSCSLEEDKAIRDDAHEYEEL